MNPKISIELEDNDWGQIIDGLTCRAATWERTAQYHTTGHADDYIEEARDAEEAQSIEICYRNIIKEIKIQRKDKKINNTCFMIVLLFRIYNSN